MASDFRSARFWAKELVEEALCEGTVAIDATMGNGYDTQWLCELVGDKGHVYAFDVQNDAVSRTRERLEKAALLHRATLFCIGHEHMDEKVRELADVIVFNLGWLPGAEHKVTTQADTTLQAVTSSLTLLKEEGLLSICVYPGHAEGAREKETLLQWASGLNASQYDATLKAYLNQANDPPLLIAVRKRKVR